VSPRRPVKTCEWEPVSRYPSPAELDAFAQKTARNPLTIKIFQTEVRVPQHKQLNKTVNGLDTTGQSYSSCPHSRGYQGLLAIVKASVTIKGVVKNSEGKRTKHSSGQASVGPYGNAPYRQGHKAYHTSSCKAPDVPTDTHCSSARASGDPGRAPRAELAQVQSLMRQMSRNPHREQLGGEARASPSVQAAAAVAPQSGVTYAGAVVPTQTAGTAKTVYLDKADYRTSWQRKQQQTQHYQHRAVRYSAGTHLSYRLPLPGVQDRGSASSLNCMQGDFSTGPYFASLWDNSLTSAPNSDSSFQSQLLGVCPARPRDLPLADHTLTGGLPTSSLCHAALLSSSLQSLECLISEIQPPCIKERMLGRGYQAVGMPLLLEPQQSHIQLPVYR
uniref:Uncharacterized protein n=1 Tax=Periophthalmus magnuspinnatus TaxID=409849 RepID=A0A3B4ATZ2_9GOBI